MTRSQKWKRCFKAASRHRKSHAGFDRALHACLARSFGEVTHQGARVWATAMRQGLRGTRKFKIDVQVYRYQGQYTALACIPKGRMRVIGGPLLKRLKPRCGQGSGASPSRAVRNALARLTWEAR